MNYFSRLALVSVSLSLVACSTFNDNKIDYKSAGKSPSLDIPPDLTLLSRDTRYAVAGNPVTASSFEPGKSTQPALIALNTLGDVRIERAGNQRWLVIDRPIEKLWDPVRDFWRENGFLLVIDQNNLGIMETDWAENRAKLPQDFIRNTLGKVFDSLYSTGERDKFRTRLERNTKGGTDIFISHKGMLEVYSSSQKDSTVWQPRTADSELEAEFLGRLMVKLGVTKEQSKTLLTTETISKNSLISMVNGQSTLQINDSFDRSWRRVGLSLDRTGFTVEDRDRSQGIYFVRYVEPATVKPESGLLEKIFGSAKAESLPLKYRIKIVTQDDLTTVTIQDSNGVLDNSSSAQRILKIMADDLK